MNTKKMEKMPEETQPDNTIQYQEKLDLLRKQLEDGSTFNQACNVLGDIDSNLKNRITEDFLKVIIAEQHFGEGQDIDDIALFLDLPYEEVENIRDDLLEEINKELVIGNYKSISKMTH